MKKAPSIDISIGTLEEAFKDISRTKIFEIAKEMVAELRERSNEQDPLSYFKLRSLSNEKHFSEEQINAKIQEIQSYEDLRTVPTFKPINNLFVDSENLSIFEEEHGYYYRIEVFAKMSNIIQEQQENTLYFLRSIALNVLYQWSQGDSRRIFDISFKEIFNMFSLHLISEGLIAYSSHKGSSEKLQRHYEQIFINELLRRLMSDNPVYSLQKNLVQVLKNQEYHPIVSDAEIYQNIFRDFVVEGENQCGYLALGSSDFPHICPIKIHEGKCHFFDPNPVGLNGVFEFDSVNVFCQWLFQELPKKYQDAYSLTVYGEREIN